MIVVLFALYTLSISAQDVVFNYSTNSLGQVYVVGLKKPAESDVPNAPNVLRISDGIYGIRANAFCGRVDLKVVYIPDSVVDIGIGSFHGCYKLEHIRMSENIQHIGSSAFWFCSSLEECRVSSDVSIGVDAFKYCYSLPMDSNNRPEWKPWLYSEIVDRKIQLTFDANLEESDDMINWKSVEAGSGYYETEFTGKVKFFRASN